MYKKNVPKICIALSIYYISRYKIVLCKFFIAASKIRAMQIRAMRNRASRGMTVSVYLVYTHEKFEILCYHFS